MRIVIAASLAACATGAAAQDINVAHYFDPLGGVHLVQSQKWLEGVTKDFTASAPDVNVGYELFAWDEIDDRMIIDKRAGIKHDVAFTSPQFMPRHAEAGSLLDLSPFVEKWSDEEKADFSWSPVWAAYPLGVPTGVHTRLVAYNKDMFSKAGLEKPPQSLDELVEDAKKLTQDTNGDGQPDVWGLGMSVGPSRATIELVFAPLIWHFGGDLWDEKAGRANFASDAGVKAAQFLYDLIYVHKVMPNWVVSGTYDDVVLKGLLNGTFAMTWGYGSYWIPALEDAGWVKGCWPATPECTAVTADVFVTPTNPKAQFSNAWTVSVPALSESPETSFRYIEQLLRRGTLENFPDGGLPARQSAWQQKQYTTDFYRTWFEAAKNGKPMPETVYYVELADTIAAALADILLKQAPIKETLQQHQDEFNASHGNQ